jgi:hypothetical protein
MLKFVLIIVFLIAKLDASPITTRPSVPTDTTLTLTSTPISILTPPKIPTPTAYTTPITTTPITTTPTTKTSKKVPPAKGDDTVDSISVTVVTVVFCVIIALFLFLCCLSANKREKEQLYNSPYTYFVK